MIPQLLLAVPAEDLLSVPLIVELLLLLAVPLIS